MYVTIHANDHIIDPEVRFVECSNSFTVLDFTLLNKVQNKVEGNLKFIDTSSKQLLDIRNAIDKFLDAQQEAPDESLE